MSFSSRVGHQCDIDASVESTVDVERSIVLPRSLNGESPEAFTLSTHFLFQLHNARCTMHTLVPKADLVLRAIATIHLHRGGQGLGEWA